MIRIRFVLFCCFYGIGLFSAHAQVPVADFSASTVSGCGPLSVVFKDLSTNTPFSWTWDFGNGQISNQQNPTISYNAPGTYTVTLIAKNASGASSERKTDYITVYPYPTPSFVADITVGCSPATIHFTDQSTPGQGTINRWIWDFPDGTTSDQQNPTHVFTQTGYYDIGLTVFNSGGCRFRGVRGKYIRVVPGVQAAFSSSQSSPGCSAPFNIGFINQTAGPGTLTYNWDLGNGSTSTVPNPTTTYPSNNPYTVTLIANSNFGCADTVTKAVSFQGGSPVITAPDQSCANATINFQNSSSPAPVSSSWDFGDGSTAAVANPAKSYAAPGTYTVTLTNTYSSCTATVTKTIQIVNGTAASFTADKTAACKAPLTANFTDQTAGSPTTWLWDFGDGSTATTQNPNHTYTTSGNYTVSLTTNTSTTGCTAAATQTDFIKISAPTIALHDKLIQGCIAPAIVHPTADISAVDGVQSYNWSSPDAASSSNTNTANPSFTYATEGYHDISLSITTKGGCSVSQLFKDGVLVGPPITPDVQPDNTNPCIHQPVTFSSTSSPVDLFVWDFGDGTIVQTAAYPPIQHKYSDTGYQTIKLAVYRRGCVQSKAFTKLIHVNAPLAGFKYTIDCADRRNVTFTDTSEIDPTKTPLTYYWDFGDGGTANTANPSHPFSTLGQHIVTETVTNGSCSDTKIDTINLTPIAVSFTSPDSVCKNAVFTVTSTSTPLASIGTYSWQVGSGSYTTPDTVASYVTHLADTGTYLISLKVMDAGGCPATPFPFTKAIQVTGPATKFTAAAGGCRNNPILFTDQSTMYPGYTPVAWTWNFGDGKPDTTFKAPPFTHKYTDTGTYTISLAVTDSRNCTTVLTATTPVKITAPYAGFYAADTVYCPNAPLPFTDSSQGNSLSYSWDFGDGSTAGPTTTPGIAHSYATDAKYYSVKLKITDGTGCSDSVTRTNYIHIQSPIAAFTLQDSTGICLPLQTSFFPAGQYYDSLYWDFGDGEQSTLDTTTHFYGGHFGTYTATLHLRGAGGCMSSTSRNITIYNPATTASVTHSIPATVCDSFLINFQITAPPYTRFTLNFGDGAADSSNNKTPSHEYNFPSTYGPQLSLQDSSGCIVPVGGGGNITVYGAVPFFNMTDKKFCDDGTVYFTDVTITNDNPVNIAWDFGDGQTSTGMVGDGSNENPSHAYTQPGIFTPKMTLNTSHGCTESYTDTVHVYQTPHPLITLPNPSCIDAPLQFQGSLTTPDADTVNWSWAFADGQTSAQQNPLITYNKAGTYIVTLRTFVSFGCSDTISQSLTINPLPVITGPAVITTPVGTPVTIPFTYSPNIATWAWTPDVNLSCNNCGNPAASPIFNTLYYVTVTDANSCSSSDSILVKTICNGDNYFIPNTFSPNNDGVNDVFYPRGTNLYNIQSMRVFNRWGQMVFERRNFPANSASDGWDGTFNNRPAPSDAYIYIVEVICNNAQVVTLKGDITLIR